MDNRDINQAHQFAPENEVFSQEISKRDEEIRRLKKKLKRQTEKCRRYERDMVNNSIVDRWKVGKYLHDNLAQKLTYTKILISFIKEKIGNSENEITADLDKALQIISEQTCEVRDLSHDIIPANVEKGEVYQAFKDLIEHTQSQYKVKCSLEGDEMLRKINSRKAATNLYHITQEAVKNAVNHGEAEKIKISVLKHGDQLHFHIKDDGKGFSYSDKKAGMGITIMKHRVEEMGGNFGIRKAEDDDFTTCVVCFLPLGKLKIEE